MKSFRQYLEEAQVSREYHLRIKTVFELDDEKMAAVEKLLKKYDLLDIDGPHKTILQDNPLDFADIDNAEIWLVDIITGMPVSAYVLQQELQMTLAMPEKYIVVRGDNDPLETETERLRVLAKIEDEAKKKGLEPKPLLSTEPAYRDHEQGEDGAKYYGNEHNKGLLKYLAAVAATRRDTEVKPASPLFDFMKPAKPDAGADFNAAIPDAPTPQPWWLADKAAKHDLKTAPEGNFDDDSRKFAGSFSNPKSGKETDISATTRSVRQRQKGKSK